MPGKTPNNVLPSHEQKEESKSPQKAFEELPPAAQRALTEAEERRTIQDASRSKPAREIDGRGGLDPTRFDDWEIDGRAVDF
ncbi:MAG: DUF1674 domain-containing protein [Hyphomicrobiales bacterium]|nr:MAG: DUF1674 domain-containing protein [Hyphomicrobiales bacterium]